MCWKLYLKLISNQYDFIYTGFFIIMIKCWVNWTIAGINRKMVHEESPGSLEPGCRVTPGEGDFKESATESKPPNSLGKGGRVR